MTTVALTAFPQYLTNGGLPLAGGQLESYEAGTLIPLATYTDRTGDTPNSNPVILDAAGRADIWLDTNVAYKLILKDSAGNTIDSVDDFYAGADPAQLAAAGIVPATGGTYTGPVSFAGGATFDGTAAQDLATLDSLGISSVQNANLWINSDLSIAQRIVVSPTVADGAYGFDRVVSLCDGGSVSYSVLQQPEDGTPYAGRTLQPDAGPKRVGLCQIVEAKNCLAYRGKNLVFSARLRVSAATTVRMALVAWTGAVDVPTRDVVNNWASTTYTAGNFFVANTSTIAQGASALAANTWTDVTISSTSAGGVVAPSTMNNLYLVIWTDTAVAQNVTLDASRLRCGLGTSVQLWTPPDAQAEFARCQRYYYQLSGTGVYAPGLCFSGSQAAIHVGFPVAMRTSPTLIANQVAVLNSSAANVAATAAVIGSPGSLTSSVNITVAAGLVAGNATILVGNAAGAYLAFPAEL